LFLDTSFNVMDLLMTILQRFSQVGLSFIITLCAG
jgi:hypothetical protein